MNKKGFTLIELVMIIVILGILAVVAIPRYFDLQTQANQSAEDGVVGGVRGGIHTYFANYQAWPSTLDDNASASCSSTDPCFDNILGQGGISDGSWSKSGSEYTGPTGGTYIYDNSTGQFM